MPNFIPKHGGYKNLLSYQKSVIIFDGTVIFCQRFLNKYDRTVDQMVQAARSGKQNIVEGSQASGTSKEMEIKLINVARASLEELLEDYFDFLRTNELNIWDKDDKATLAIRKLSQRNNITFEAFKRYIENRSAGTVANIMICLINQATFLLRRQLIRLEKDFVEKGGLKEAMFYARKKTRGH